MLPNSDDSRIRMQAVQIYETVKNLHLTTEKEDFDLEKCELEKEAFHISAVLSASRMTRTYDSQMESAAQIAITAKSMIAHLTYLFSKKLIQAEYFEKFSREMEVFRGLFLEWMSTFDRSIYFVDKWGIFNPPGVGPYDKGPVFDAYDYFDSPF